MPIANPWRRYIDQAPSPIPNQVPNLLGESTVQTKGEQQIPAPNRKIGESFFLQASLYRCGAKSLGAKPLAQVESQNAAVRPFPIVTVVLHLNRCLSASEHGTSEPTQDRSGSAHWNQRSRRVGPCWISRISRGKCLVWFVLEFLRTRAPRWESYMYGVLNEVYL